MRRNVAGQFVTCKLINKADGTPCTTGTTTVYVTGDAGTQAAGSVGSGAATHEGNGVWSYAPAQAETNYTQVDFVFVNTAAVNAGPSIYPTAYDANGRYDVGAIGGTAQTARDIGASVLLSSGTGTGQLDFTSGVVKANATQWLGGTIPAVNVTGVPLVDLKYTLGTLSPATAGTVRADAVTGLTAADVAAIKAKTDNLPADPADASDIAASFSTVNSTLATIAGYIDTEVASIITAISSTGVVLTSAERNAVADALLDRTSGVETGLTVRQAHRLQVAAAAGKLSGAATTSVTIRNAVADSKDRIVATVDADGNRSAITLDLT